MNIIPKLANDIESKELVSFGQDYEKVIEFQTEEDLSEEAYRIKIDKEKIQVTSKTAQGRIWAKMTLQQLCSDKGELPICQIEDQPRYPHRGLHIDCARNFHSIDELKKIIDEISKVKLNEFHWHLSDDQGWRVEIEKYPRLYQQEGNKNYYTKTQIRDFVSYAAKHGVEVIPEIDMPGHTRAITAAYPSYSCTGEKVQLAPCGGIFPVILCPGKEETFSFVEDIIDEMVPLFPGRYFHIGGDEAPKHRWKECPYCQKRMQEEGLQDETELQGYFNRRIANYLKEKYGKKVILWNDSMEFEKFLAPEDLVQYWSLDHKKQLPSFVDRKGQFIYSDMFDLYYDYVPAMSPMKRSYTCKPIIGQTDYGKQKCMIGFEACTWSEYITDAKTLEERIFPRIYAMAENAWSGGEEENYKDFTNRLKIYKNSFANVTWGNGDPKGFQKLKEKLSYAKSMATGMDPEVKAMTTEAAAVSDEFMETFKKKMLK